MAIRYTCDICKKGFMPIEGIINGRGKMMLPLGEERLLDIEIKTIKCREVCFRCMGRSFVEMRKEESGNDSA